MTREEWERFDRIEHEPNVKFAMRARCEEQGHDWENACSFMPMRVYQVCKWCGERR